MPTGPEILVYLGFLERLSLDATIVLVPDVLPVALIPASSGANPGDERSVLRVVIDEAQWDVAGGSPIVDAHAILDTGRPTDLPDLGSALIRTRVAHRLRQACFIVAR